VISCLNSLTCSQGMRIGFDTLGGKCVFSSEIDKHARETYELNFKEKPQGDIREIDAQDIPKHDLLVAGFPCQPFSIAGVSKLTSMGREHGFLEETKGTLFFEICRVLKHHQPKVILLENVKGLTWHDEGKTFTKIKETLQQLGYTLSFKVVNSKNFVPQRRERIFIVGFNDGTRFEFPESPNKLPVLNDILDDNVDPKYTINDHLWNYHQERKRKQKEKGNGFGYKMFNRTQSSGTLSARYYKDGAEILIEQPGFNPRKLTPRECARLMGFPEGFKLNKSENQSYKQLGNAVVASLVSHIAESIAITAGWND
jgi:DNA (cytosine-5)-methyltransferase 1